MIAINNVSVSFSGHDLFNDLSFIIQPKDKIGLTGKNGVGKSTLLKIILGIQEPDSGGVALSEGDTLGYLPQELEISSQKTVLEETLSAFAEVQDLDREIAEINKQLEERTDYESDSYADLIQSLSEKHEKLNLLDPSKAESNCERILKGLGFTADDFDKPLRIFSGGKQMRVELAKLLVVQPTLLLLDEPTNHLDIDAIIWLEGFLKDYNGAVLMISHDRMFLDNVTNRTVEIVNGKIFDYNVPYSKYLVKRAERMELQMAAKKNQQKYIEEQERFIERFRAKASKSKQAQSKIKQLEKIEEIEVDDQDTSKIKFSFPPAPHSGKVTVKGKKVRKSYGDNEVFSDVNFEIEKGERIAFVGQNGMGKSTLVKLIAENEPHKGEITLGHKVKLGYYAQLQEGTMPPHKTVYQIIDEKATGEWRNITKIRSLLGAFLFDNNDVDKRVKVLSGGEKSRLALAQLLLEPVNLLILDEPTNHLDMDSKAVLKDALLRFEGTLIVVSHDRDFLKGLTDKTYEFKDGVVKEYLGDIDYFLEKQRVEDFRGFEQKKKSAETLNGLKKEKKKKQTPAGDEKMRNKELKRIKTQIKTREKKIAEAEEQIAEMEKQMNEPGFYESKESKQVFFEHGELTKKLDRYMIEWENLLEEQSALES